MSRSNSPGRHTSHQNLGDVHVILKNLKDEVADLHDQIESKNSSFFKKYANDLAEVADGAEVLYETLKLASAGMGSRERDTIPAAIPDFRVDVRERDLGKVCRNIHNAVQDAKMAYHNLSLQAKDVVNDADKMDIVVKACQTEFIKLKLMTNNTKARLNAHRIGWARLGDSFRKWAEMVHFATIECIKNEMDEVEAEAAQWRAEFGDSLDRARSELEKLLGGQRRIKMQLMLKKMKNSRQAAAFSTWFEALMARKFADAEAERQRALAEFNARFAHMSAEEIERKLRQFMLRWINRKVLPVWSAWKSLLIAKRQAALQAELDAELAAMRAKMAAMANNASMAKLKIYFARKLGQMKGMCFKALSVFAAQQKALKLLESEAGQRLKQFLASKLQSTGRKCWSAWLRHHDNIAMENMKNNDRAQKVALLLEKLARGIVHRQFSAFVRHLKMAQEERAAFDAINGRLAAMDEFNKAKLRIFLDAKRLGKMSSFFKWWADCMRNHALYALQEQIEAEDAAMKELAQRMADAEAALGGKANQVSGKRGKLLQAQAEIQRLEGVCRDLDNQLYAMKNKIGETEEMVDYEKSQRKEALAKIAALERELDMTIAERDRISNELASIAGDIGCVHSDSQY